MRTCDLVQQQNSQTLRDQRGGTRQEIAMNVIINSDFEQIDHKTSRSICDAVGERLQQSMRRDISLSPHLQRLVDELRRRDGELH